MGLKTNEGVVVEKRITSVLLVGCSSTSVLRGAYFGLCNSIVRVSDHRRRLWGWVCRFCCRCPACDDYLCSYVYEETDFLHLVFCGFVGAQQC